MPLDFSFSFRNGEVGGDKGFDAALAFRNCEAAESALEGDSRKTMITIHNTTPTTIVIGFVRRNDRTGPMAPVFSWVSSIDEVATLLLHSHSSRAALLFRRGAETRSRLRGIENLRCGWQSSVVNNNLLKLFGFLA